MLLPVISALVVGTTLIVLFSIMFTGTIQVPASDMELLDSSEQTKEVKAFLSTYPHSIVQYSANENRAIEYIASIVDDGKLTHELVLKVMVNRATGEIQSISLTCTKLNGVVIENTFSENIEERILKGRCLDF